MKYLVVACEGPGFTSDKEAAEVLESAVLPTFDRLLELEAKGTIIAGGIRAGSRSFVFIVEAKSNDEVDKMLRDLPLWAAVSWDVTPLQTLQGRAEMERKIVKRLK